MAIKLGQKQRRNQRSLGKKTRWSGQIFKRLGQGLSCIFVFFAVSYSVFWCLYSVNFPISAVRVVGETRHLAQQDFKSAIYSEVGKGFFRLKVSTLQQQLLSLTWIRQVDVRKIWPNQLVVKFHEHEPAAIWKEKGVLSVTGMLFYPEPTTMKELNLPMLHGPEGKSALVWQQFLVMEETLAPLHLAITHLTLAPRGAWHLRLSNGTTIVLGTNDVMTRLHRFVSAYEQLHARQQQMVYVDLRYTSGMAIAWKSV